MDSRTVAVRLIAQIDAAMAELQARGIDPPSHWMMWVPSGQWLCVECCSYEMAARLRLLQDAGAVLPCDVTFYAARSGGPLTSAGGALSLKAIGAVMVRDDGFQLVDPTPHEVTVAAALPN